MGISRLSLALTRRFCAPSVYPDATPACRGGVPTTERRKPCPWFHLEGGLSGCGYCGDHHMATMAVNANPGRNPSLDHGPGAMRVTKAT